VSAGRRRWSYSSESKGIAARLREAWNLTAALLHDVDAGVDRDLMRLRRVEEAVVEETGLVMRDLDVLDVGAGQLLLAMMYFGRGNRVVGIDQNVIAQGFDPLVYWRMLRANGPDRVLKTLARKALGIDRRYRRRFTRLVGLERVPPLRVLEMDAGALTFDSGSFDLVYSLLVLQHVQEPARVLHEVARVVRPGGVAYLDFTVYTAPTGALDVRALGGRSTTLPPWAHLRSGVQDQVQESAYLNRLRLPEWEVLFAEIMPGAIKRLSQAELEEYELEAQRLRESGELSEYSLEELLTTNAAFIWRKPAAAT
jgi:SAM-dependent methyltransferase